MIRPPPRSPPFPYTALFRSDRLVDVGRADRLAQEALGLRVGHRDLLAQRDGRGLVRHAEAEQLAHGAPTSSRGRSCWRAATRSSISAKSRSRRPRRTAMIAT